MQKAPSHERPLNVWMFLYSSSAQTLSISILSAGLLLFSFFPLFCSPSYSPRIDQGHGILHNYRLRGHDWLMSDRTLTEAWTLRSESEWVSGRVFLFLFLFLFTQQRLRPSWFLLWTHPPENQRIKKMKRLGVFSRCGFLLADLVLTVNRSVEALNVKMLEGQWHHFH